MSLLKVASKTLGLLFIAAAIAACSSPIIEQGRGADLALSANVSGSRDLGASRDLTVHFKNTQNWSQVYLYAWDDSGTPLLGNWPGTPMTAETGLWFVGLIPGVSTSNLIFNAGNGGPQTADLRRTGDGWYADGVWYDHDPADMVVHFLNNQNWSQVYLYAWDGSGTPLLGNWPGTPMSAEEENWFVGTIPGVNSSNLIFNGGNGGPQTADLQRTGDGWYANGLWYDQKPQTQNLKVHFLNEQNWTQVYLYSWDGAGTPLTGNWPGTPMSAEADNWFTGTIPGVNSSNLIFNAGSGGPQTADLQRTGDGWYAHGVWYDHNPADLAVRFLNSQNWSQVYLYAWNDSGTPLLGGWPGTLMTAESGNWYKGIIPGVSTSNLIFNAGNGGPQTADLRRTGDGWYADGVWYDMDPALALPSISLDYGTNGAIMPVALTTGGTFSVTPKIVSLSPAQISYTIDAGAAQGAADGQAIDLTAALSASSGSSNQVVLTVTAVNQGGSVSIIVTYQVQAAPLGLDVSSRGTASDPWLPLGAFVHQGSTYFRIWSPDSSDVKVAIDGQPGVPATLLPAVGIYRHIYEYKTTGSLEGRSYLFQVGGKNVRDPYGRMLVHGSAPEDFRNVVMDMSKNGRVRHQVDDDHFYKNREDAIIYEVHVRDFTIDPNSGVSAKGKFPGMVERGTSYAGKKTGLAHLKELGITHVQLLPVYNFYTSMYNWGYDPESYNVPEEQYSTKSESDAGGRVREFREMINSFHDHGIRVNMDVVYNHTFKKEILGDITGRYYTAQDLSGVGNSLNTGVPLVSRFIRDSLEFWVDSYGIDGFRFDVMGVFHYGEVQKWSSYLNKRFPQKKLLMYGEPWNGSGSDPEGQLKVRLGKLPAIAADPDAHVGGFNSEFRDSIKGGNNDNSGAFITNASPGKWWGSIAVGMRGSIMASKSTLPLGNDWDSMFAYDPEQSINYMSVHDNLAIADKVMYTLGNPGWHTPDAQVTKTVNFAASIILTSEGIPMIHAGDEVLRTKTAEGTYPFSYSDASGWSVHNTYKAPDSVNQIRWQWKHTNETAFKYWKDLIKLRKRLAFLRLTTWDDINERVRTELNAGTNPAEAINTVNNASLPANFVVSYYDTSRLSECGETGELDNDWWDDDRRPGKKWAVVYNAGDAYTISLPAGKWVKYFDDRGFVKRLDRNSFVCKTGLTVFRQK